jgi:hypothetical protein
MTRPSTAIPGPAHRAELNATLHATGADTGFWDDAGRPAPWPDDIDDWRPTTSEPASSPPTSNPSNQDPLEDQPIHHVQGLDLAVLEGGRPACVDSVENVAQADRSVVP